MRTLTTKQSNNWKYLGYGYDRKKMRMVAKFYDVKYGFTGYMMDDKRKVKIVVVVINDPKKYSPRYFSKRSATKYRLTQLRKFGRVIKSF